MKSVYKARQVRTYFFLTPPYGLIAMILILFTPLIKRDEMVAMIEGKKAGE